MLTRKAAEETGRGMDVGWEDCAAETGQEETVLTLTLRQMGNQDQ